MRHVDDFKKFLTAEVNPNQGQLATLSGQVNEVRKFLEGDLRHSYIGSKIQGSFVGMAQIYLQEFSHLFHLAAQCCQLSLVRVHLCGEEFLENIYVLHFLCLFSFTDTPHPYIR